MTRGLCAFTIIAVDWNGTMVNDADRAWRATTMALESLGLADHDPGSLTGFRSAFRLPMEAFFRGLGVPDQSVDEAVTSWNEAMLTIPATLAPGALRLLQDASEAGIPVVVISGAREDVIRHDCEVLGVTGLIDRIHGSVHPKREVLGRYATKGTIAYIGDTSYDVTEGIAAGAITVAVDFGYGASDSLVDAAAIVSDLSGVLVTLRALS